MFQMGLALSWFLWVQKLARPRSLLALVRATAVQHKAALQRHPVLSFSIQFIAQCL